MGSDWSVSTPDPLQEMHVAVNRRCRAAIPTRLRREEVFLPDERLDLPTALPAFTMGSAFVNHLDHETGSIEEGKLADLALVDRNLFDHPATEIADARVLRPGWRASGCTRPTRHDPTRRAGRAHHPGRRLHVGADPERDGPAMAAATLPRALVYRCRLVATDRGDSIALSMRLRTNEPRDRWRIRIVHEGERVLEMRRGTDAQGDLKVRVLVRDAPGRDDVRVRARHLEPRAVCTVATAV